MFGKILSSTVNIFAYVFRVYSFLYVIKYIIVNDCFCHLCGVILTLNNSGCDTELPNSNNIDNPDSEGDNVDENDSDGEQDHQHYIVQQDENDDDNNDIENNVPLPQVPLVNFNGDVEHEEDFGNGWEWTETDPGSSCGPFIGQPGLLIQPASRTPEGFFNLLFDLSMWTLLAQQTNIYARQRIQQLCGIIYLLFIYVLQNVL